MKATEVMRERIKEIMVDRPGITHGQLVEETGLAPNTVTKYMRAIRAEWQGKKE